MLIKYLKGELEPLTITGTSSRALLANLYLQVLLPYLELSYCSCDKVGLNTLGGEPVNYWQDFTDPRLKLKSSIVPHGGDAEPLNALRGNNKNGPHKKGLREQVFYAGVQLSTFIWGLLTRSGIVVPIAPVVSAAVLCVSQ